MKIAIIDDYQDAFRGLECSKKLAGHELIAYTDTEKDPARLAARLQDAEVLVLTQQRSPLLLIPAAVSWGLFAWLLTLHPGATGRIYAAYGGVYVAIALIWLWRIDGVVPTRWDLVGSAVALAGMAIIMLQPARPV